MSCLRRDIAEDEVDHLFAASDDDGDDLLGFLEVLEHHDVFVGSEATDYGDHLHNLDRFEDELWGAATVVVMVMVMMVRDWLWIDSIPLHLLPRSFTSFLSI